MNSEQVKNFLREAGMQQEQINGLVKESVLGLRKRKPKEQPRELPVQFNPPQVQSNYKIIGYYKPQYKPQTFQTEFTNFKKNKVRDRQLIQWQRQNIKLLQAIYAKVASEGGIIELLSKGRWDRITKQMRLTKEQLRGLGDQQILKIYLEHLIEFQMTSVGTPLNLKKGVEVKQTLRNGNFIHQENRAFLNSNEIQIDLLNEQIVVIQNAVKTLGLQQINLARINEQCGHQSVQLRIQNPLDYGFNPYRLMNKDDRMTIKEYCQYQKHFQDQNYCKQNFGDKLKGGKVFFAVNFQPTCGTILQEMQQKLKNTLFGWVQPNDLLSYLQQHINGCTNPQLYLKVRGVWTGGHQENINMCAININHGPSDSEWYTVPGEDVQRLRKTLRQKFKQDLYEQEGLWFEKINWFIENGFKVTRIIQKPGDMVVSGPGTLHWVRAYGVSLHSAWNIFPHSQKMFISAFHRHHENKKIRFRKSNIIPLKILTLKHIEHKMLTLSEQEKYQLLMHITKWLTEQESQMSSIKLHYQHIGLQVEQKKIQQHQSFCKVCLQQIMVYYIEDDDNKIMCLSCMMDTDPFKEDLTVFYKTDPKQLFKFISKTLTDQSHDDSFKYCSGEHIGMQCLKSKCQKAIHLSSLTTQSTHYGEKIKAQEVQIASTGVQTEVIQSSLKRKSTYNVENFKENNQLDRKPNGGKKRLEKQLGEISEDQSAIKESITKKHKNNEDQSHSRGNNNRNKDKHSKKQRQRSSEQNYSKERSRSRDKIYKKYKNIEENGDHYKKNKGNNHENRQNSTGKGQDAFYNHEYSNEKYEKHRNNYKKVDNNDKEDRKREFNNSNGLGNSKNASYNNRDSNNEGYNGRYNNRNNYNNQYNQNQKEKQYKAQKQQSTHEKDMKNKRKRSDSQISY